MSLFSKIRGSHVIPSLYQRYRPEDGVRGVFSSRDISAGVLLFRIPVHYCYFPYGFEGIYSTEKTCRSNRHVHLFPEFEMWRRRLDRQKLGDVGAPVLLHASSSASVDVKREVQSVRLSSVEAALTISIALRYFLLHVPHQSAVLKGDNAVFPRSSVALAYIKSLPINVLLRRGVESLFHGTGEGLSLHICLEQLAGNICDFILSHVSNATYSVIDRRHAEFEELVLVTLYVVRSRIISLLLLCPTGDFSIPTLAPGLDALNHSVTPNAAGAVAPLQKTVVIRAVQRIPSHSEITINYQPLLPFQSSKNQNACSEDPWETRYLMRNGI